MGTNYYLHLNPCKHCNRTDPPIHIGKSSYGWKFSFNGTNLKTFEEWKSFLRANDGCVFNEYGEPVSVDKLLELIESKKDGISTSGKDKELLREWEDGPVRFIPGEFS